jgi:two-component system C4-dicarboxylate transport response regulator DctD
MNRAKVLLVDDDDDLRHALTQGLEIDGFDVKAFPRAQEIFELISSRFYGVIVSDMRMGAMDGNALLKKVMEIDASLPVILITGHGDVGMAVSAMRAGAYDFIEKPFATSHLSAVISRAIEKRRLVLENRTLRENLDLESTLDKTLVGRHPSIMDVRAQITMLSTTDIDVLLTGETGTGKDVAARALHDEGTRKSGPFVAINCGALPREIIESELFGHEAGAFTGAQKKRIGKMEHANGGTLFLDEIESMPMELQVKLLRAVEERAIERLGSNTSIPLDIRLIAASKTSLKQESANGNFRQDLYFRLDVASIYLPPLRNRGNDIVVLFYHLTRRARARFRREIPEISPTLEAQLTAHNWPGNVRELRNAADRFVLGLDLGIGEVRGGENNRRELGAQMAAFERAVIQGEIARNNGALKPTYENLNISRKALYEKMKRLGLHELSGD